MNAVSFGITVLIFPHNDNYCLIKLIADLILAFWCGGEMEEV